MEQVILSGEEEAGSTEYMKLVENIKVNVNEECDNLCLSITPKTINDVIDKKGLTELIQHLFPEVKNVSAMSAEELRLFFSKELYEKSADFPTTSLGKLFSDKADYIKQRIDFYYDEKEGWTIPADKGEDAEKIHLFSKFIAKYEFRLTSMFTDIRNVNDLDLESDNLTEKQKVDLAALKSLPRHLSYFENSRINMIKKVTSRKNEIQPNKKGIIPDGEHLFAKR